MANLSIESLDKLYLNYGYDIANTGGQKLRVYTLRYGMYHAAEIVKVDEAVAHKKIKKEYSEAGFATEVRDFKSIEEAEKALFKGFFIKTPLSSKLNNKYEKFVNKQIANLPDGSEYNYINSPVDFTLFDTEGTLVDRNLSENDSQQFNLINKINDLIGDTEGPLFIIIEAAAGFGKTCSAYEILNTFSVKDKNKLPFFTELSRNREARVFKHILHNEVEQQFPSGIKSEVVLNQIKKGRIPLIIDGFDELLSKDLTFSSKDFTKVESMLSTIVDLLEENATIIITSRKTAIFKSEEFYNWANSTKNDFSVARFEIKEPTIENWLNPERLKIIRQENFPVEQLANPVLLAYLRNISLAKLKEYFRESGTFSIVDRYINYLLKREKERQNLKITEDNQLRIYKKLVRLMTEFDCTSESKGFIKDLIKDYNKKIIINSLYHYTPDEKPSIDDQAETLANHVFLDRKESGNVGFVNDFIFGFLIGENLISGKYKEYYSDFYKIIPQTFAVLAVTAFKIYSKEKQIELWNIFNENEFGYDQSFYFTIDLLFKEKISRDYEQIEIKDMEISSIKFGSTHRFNQVVFSNVVFNSCDFDLNSFNQCSFISCSFYDCKIIRTINEAFKSNFQIFSCRANNKFIDKVYSTGESTTKIDTDEITDYDILAKFFNVGNVNTRHRELSNLRKDFGYSEFKKASDLINDLETNGYLVLDGDIGHLTKEGISYFHKLKKKQ